MFTNSLIVLQQIIVMFLLILMGYVLFRRNVFTNHTTQSLTVLLNKYIVFLFCCGRSSARSTPILATPWASLLCAACFFS